MRNTGFFPHVWPAPGEASPVKRPCWQESSPGPWAHAYGVCPVGKCHAISIRSIRLYNIESYIYIYKVYTYIYIKYIHIHIHIYIYMHDYIRIHTWHVFLIRYVWPQLMVAPIPSTPARAGRVKDSSFRAGLTGWECQPLMNKPWFIN